MLISAAALVLQAIFGRAKWARRVLVLSAAITVALVARQIPSTDEAFRSRMAHMSHEEWSR